MNCSSFKDRFSASTKKHAHGDERGHRAVTAAAAAAGAGGSKKIISSMSRENGTKIKSDPNRCAAIQETH
ncbi:Hypothetical predicted protein [Cloeon dipterum]|uniref:Uncharacterized protein n=1 Tax=Cloeon dipterum TaxID=197152 RepID=A0A8S1D4W0_9INSE|nr:Hypothetical predicted protein [Cloeon dipterum]